MLEKKYSKKPVEIEIQFFAKDNIKYNYSIAYTKTEMSKKIFFTTHETNGLNYLQGLLKKILN